MNHWGRQEAGATFISVSNGDWASVVTARGISAKHAANLDSCSRMNDVVAWERHHSASITARRAAPMPVNVVPKKGLEPLRA